MNSYIKIISKVFFLFLVCLTFTVNAQNFFEHYEQNSEIQDSNKGFFSNQDNPEFPEQSEDCFDCDDYPQVPIDNWLLLLPIAGIAIGVYWLRKKSKLTA